jgi:hypothetical protein
MRFPKKTKQSVCQAENWGSLSEIGENGNDDPVLAGNCLPRTFAFFAKRRILR